MFELKVAKKYLIPRKRQLSVSLIAIMSVAVISLVVWLVLVFLSITEGIERGWMQRLTSLSAPLRITPTEAYYSSYYYKIDELSSGSGYNTRTIGEKLRAESSDPYLKDSDMQLPSHFPLPESPFKDPVKEAFSILESHHLAAQEYEVGGALMRLEMLRPKSTVVSARGDETESVLTQASYLTSFQDKNPSFSSLLLPLRMVDINNLFYLANHSGSFKEEILPLCESLSIQQIKTTLPHWRLPSSLIPDGASFSAETFFKKGNFSHLFITKQGKDRLERKAGRLFVVQQDGTKLELSEKAPLLLDKEISFTAELLKDSLEEARELKDLQFKVSSALQGARLEGQLAWDGVEISQAKVLKPFKLPSHGVLLARHFQDSGVKVGDKGHLSYSARGASSIQEQRQPMHVAGFYDPGILSVGGKNLIVSPEMARTVNASSSLLALDPALYNGIHVWFSDLSCTEEIKASLEKAFQKAGISSYWKITSFKEYDFAKDLLQQFQSDKYLFSLIGVIILIVACCNIISLLVLLVNDKKKEIGILQAMGASPFSIAAIFGLSGVFMGIISSAIGTLAAFLTLSHIDAVVGILSFFQGHDAFQSAFYGTSLPDKLSSSAVYFVLVATPIISLCAGLVPAIKACRLRPSEMLRSQ